MVVGGGLKNRDRLRWEEKAADRQTVELPWFRRLQGSGKMVLLFVVPSFLFLGGLGIMMWAETKCTRRNEDARDPMFGGKHR